MFVFRLMVNICSQVYVKKDFYFYKIYIFHELPITPQNKNILLHMQYRGLRA